MALLLTFLSAAAVDFAWLRWTASAHAGRLIPAAAWSVVIGGLGLVGLAGALQPGWASKVAYLAGLATGSALAAYLRQRTAT